MFDLVVRRVAALAAAPALFVLSAPAMATGPIVPARPQVSPPPIATHAPTASRPATPAPTAPAPAPVTSAPRPPAPAASAPPAPRTTADPAEVRARSAMVQVLRLTNTERRTAGCPDLTVDGQLVTASLRQSNYMARTRLFSHVWRDGSTFIDRSEAAGYEQPAGENIAWGYRSAPEAMNAWMASPGHRKNILNCKARSMGAGVAYAADGTPYYTQVFGWK
ncbi:CAP domain-containing protein [Actinoplanes sp. NEAU-A12]|uniref:CAP domain-containing protein n=1 Tax=Actinoplanes sandaracinus TaxID=3045177 RepID=A0ABT6WW35_9ACTN|nr:CAP domain-containing protein [Actinoplanes sandaracinus]MDI6103934.1 CAP domain-containing protein [Actinoplanes sandaracinus]